MALKGYSGAWGKLSNEKNLKPTKISCETPFNCNRYIILWNKFNLRK
jgi:hypothetical protein